MPGEQRFLRDNTFLVAAVALPLLVVVFFLAASALPRWTVAPPAYDLLVRTYRPYDGAVHPLKLAYDLDVTNGKLQLTVRPLATEQYQQKPVLFLFDHWTLESHEIPLTITDVAPASAQTTVLDPVPGRRLITDAKAPDGYTLQPRPYHGGGIFGDVFGMHSYQAGMVLTKGGRIIPLTLPEPYESQSSAYFLAWVAND
jgi:hypothetical protein